MNSGIPGNIFFYIPILLLFCWLIYWSLLHQLILRCGWLIDLFGGASTALSMQEHKTDITKKKFPSGCCPRWRARNKPTGGEWKTFSFQSKKTRRCMLKTPELLSSWPANRQNWTLLNNRQKIEFKAHTSSLVRGERQQEGCRTGLVDFDCHRSAVTVAWSSPIRSSSASESHEVCGRRSVGNSYFMLIIGTHTPWHLHCPDRIIP